MKRHIASAIFVVLLLSSGLYAQRVVEVFPQFVSGGGWSSDIFVSNQGLASTSVDISFYGDGGETLTVDSSLGQGSTFLVNLGGGNTNVIRVNSTGPARNGYVLLGFDTSAMIRGTEVFRFQQNGVVLSSLGVPLQVPDATFSFPVEVDRSRGVNTGVALANGAFSASGSVAQSCVVTLIQNDGEVVGAAVLNLGLGQHVAYYLDDPNLFPGLDGFTGVVTVSASAGIGVLALRQDQAAFGGISVDSGPVLSPFAVNAGPTAEAEPNGSRTAAQRLIAPVVVAGNISTAGDADYFQFSGRQGDVVSVLASTFGLNSALDPVLFLADANGTVLAQNDQSGVPRSDDSFLEFVLPSDGTYYLVITDFFNRGGPNGFYRLHVQTRTPGFPLP